MDRSSSTTSDQNLEGALARVRASFGRQGLVGTLGAWLVELEPGRAAIEIPFSNRVAGRSGRYHSAVVAGIAQACGGSAAGTLVSESTELAAGSIELAFTGVPEGDLLHAEGHATSAGDGRWTVAVDVRCRNGGTFHTVATGKLTLVARP